MIPRNRREIRTDILRENMEKIRAKVPAGVKVLAVVKADVVAGIVVAAAAMVTILYLNKKKQEKNR